MALETTAAIAAFIVILSVLGVVYYGLIVSSKSAALEGTGPVRKEVHQEDEAVPVVAAGRRNAASRMQATRRRRQEAAAASSSNAPQQGAHSDSESDPEDEEETGPHSAMTKKERKRAEKLQEKEARLAAQQARENKTSVYDERQKAKIAKREADRLIQEEEIRRAEEERLKKEDEEAAKWMSMISVDKEGTGECDDQEESQGLLASFIDYIKQRKTVPLEQLATEFKLRTTEVIDRVQGLEAMGRLTGVMDERGKYIYISLEEMQAVANYINTKGRVAISELAAKSDTFIDMEVKASQVQVAGAPIIDFDSLVVETSEPASS